MFKKYGIALFAVVLAAASSAFTTPGELFKPLISYPFQYNSGSFTSGAVETNSNWIPGTGTGCGSTQNKACRIDVLSTYTHDDGTGTQVLNTSGSVLSITAIKGANNVDHVPQGSASITAVNSKP